MSSSNTRNDGTLRHWDDFLAYNDLTNANSVYEALLGYGMFPYTLPPCFKSEDLVGYVKGKTVPQSHTKTVCHYYIEYRATRNTNIPRQFAIPHPVSHWRLCKTIQENWKPINSHIGKPKPKFNFCHVRSTKAGKHIFDMNYDGADKQKQEELEQTYSMGRPVIVRTDIANCFPSIYSHSIPWAIKSKDESKRDNRHWSDKLDTDIRNCKDGETNGILVGPHTSNVTSEIILTAVDLKLQTEKFDRVIRKIDDYIYFAKDQEDALNFLNCLDVSLKEYELVLNQKKTEIISLDSFLSEKPYQKLARFNFPKLDEGEDKMNFTPVSAYINYALELANKTSNYSVINFAVKVIHGKELTDRAKKLYVKKILALTIVHPYLLLLLEEYVFPFRKENLKEELPEFLKALFTQGLKFNSTDSLTFSFYFAIKYELDPDWLEADSAWSEKIIRTNDCIPILLAWKYAHIHQSRLSSHLERFKDKFDDINRPEKAYKRNRDKFWLFWYEYARENNIPLENRTSKNGDDSLEELRKAGVTFLKFTDSSSTDETSQVKPQL